MRTFSPKQPDTDVTASTSEPRALRTVSSLKANEQFAIPKRSRFQGALYFYNNKFKGGIREPEVLWMSLISQVLFPEIPQKPTTTFIKNKFKNLLKNTSEAWTSKGAVHLVSVKKDPESKTFRVTVPILALDNSASFPGLSRAAIRA